MVDGMSANGTEAVQNAATVVIVGSDEEGTMMIGHRDVRGNAISLMTETVVAAEAAVETGIGAAVNESGARALRQRRGNPLLI